MNKQQISSMLLKEVKSRAAVLPVNFMNKTRLKFLKSFTITNFREIPYFPTLRAESSAAAMPGA
ncbi:hypothetical protein [Marinobacter nanhaiticus]|uniref:hypothetical protein n=1 Tax=Marinobacter nanhaiticus TaxID=1305740 RepID=UPI0012B67D5C|nr:hypothetical protein [Marinobacter nanhaiticus]